MARQEEDEDVLFQPEESSIHISGIDDWCQRVRETCVDYCQKQDAVTLCKSALNDLANEIHSHPAWDEEEWHYSTPSHWNDVRKERIALYILALDSINFCFWPSESGYEYEDLATSLTAAAKADHDLQEADLTQISSSYFCSAQSLRDMTLEKITKALCPKRNMPLLEERCRLWQEVGRVLVDHFDSSAYKLIQQAQGSPVKAVGLLVEYFPGFRDCTPSCTFLKRAQICVGDWQAALKLSEWQPEMKDLTTFADYRLPQLLRDRGVFVYNSALARRVDYQLEIPAFCPAELSIRAATVVAVDQLVTVLNQRTSADKNWTAVSVDWHLWQVGERLKEQLKPHHRVRTTYY